MSTGLNQCDNQQMRDTEAGRLNQPNMKVTFIIRGKSDSFFCGNSDTYPVGHSMHVVGLGELPSNTARFDRLNHVAIHGNDVTIKVGSSNAFRDRVELNQLIRAGVTPTYKLESRLGYKLATFTFTN